MTRTGITAYRCGASEAALFRKMASHYGVTIHAIEAPLSEANIRLAAGDRCISVDHKAQITDVMLQALSHAGVRYISTRSIGYNHIDMEYAERVGITVGNVAYSPDSVADYTIMLMLMLLRNAKSTLSRADSHDYRLNDVRGKELRDMTVGVVGTGRIGTAVINRLQGFGCHILAYDKRAKTSADYVPLAALLERSDVVTLHTPLHEGTYHLLNHQRLGQMKPGAYVINTGRGPLLDTDTLIEALQHGSISGAALDVIEGEEGIFYTDHTDRPVDSKLLMLQEMSNVIITGHSAFYTDHALRDMVEHSISNCLQFEKEHEAWINQKEKIV